MKVYRSKISPMLVHLVVLCLFAVGSVQAGVAERVVRDKAAGIDVIVYPMNVKDVATVHGTMPLGDAYVASKATNPAVPVLTAMLLEQGTLQRSKFEISEKLSALGARVSFRPSGAALGMSAKSMSRDLDTVIGLMAEQLRMPAFAADEFAKVKTQMEANVRRSEESADANASDAMTLALFPSSSHNAPVPREKILKAIADARLEDVRAFHKKYYGPAHMTLVFTGDVDPVKVRAAVAKAFNGWSGGVDFDRTREPPVTPSSREITISMKDKAAVSVLFGQATGLRHSDADYLPLSVGTAVLGSGFTGRLMSSIRVREGLTYGIRAGLFGSEIVDGGFAISTSFAPQLKDKGIASTRRELQKWWEEGITANELTSRKKALVGRFQISLGTTDGMAAALLATVTNGVGIDQIDTYPRRVDALTVEQVNEVIRKYLDPEKMVTVQAGTFSE